ncbi:hypothetical protein J6590_078028 [Homalodisca vitripennis]|nr:hypothetical protein J6590_078028 [Homalodisca vitripennis]
MEDARRNNTTPPPPDAEETPLSQPRKVECPVCMVNLPTVALRLCGHTLCRTCADRVHTCPTCRALIVGRFNIYLPSVRGTLGNFSRQRAPRAPPSWFPPRKK